MVSPRLFWLVFIPPGSVNWVACRIRVWTWLPIQDFRVWRWSWTNLKYLTILRAADFRASPSVGIDPLFFFSINYLHLLLQTVILTTFVFHVPTFWYPILGFSIILLIALLSANWLFNKLFLELMNFFQCELWPKHCHRQFIFLDEVHWILFQLICILGYWHFDSNVYFINFSGKV